MLVFPLSLFSFCFALFFFFCFVLFCLFVFVVVVFHLYIISFTENIKLFFKVVTPIAQLPVFFLLTSL